MNFKLLILKYSLNFLHLNTTVSAASDFHSTSLPAGGGVDLSS